MEDDHTEWLNVDSVRLRRQQNILLARKLKVVFTHPFIQTVSALSAM